MNIIHVGYRVGDVLIVKLDTTLTEAVILQMNEQLSGIFGGKVMVVDKFFNGFGVVRRERHTRRKASRPAVGGRWR